MRKGRLDWAQKVDKSWNNMCLVQRLFFQWTGMVDYGPNWVVQANFSSIMCSYFARSRVTW